MKKENWHEKLALSKERKLDLANEEIQRLKDVLKFIGLKVSSEWKNSDADFIRTQLISILVNAAK